MMAKTLPELGTDLLLYGKTKVFLRNKAINIIDKKFQEKVYYHHK